MLDAALKFESSILKGKIFIYHVVP